MTGAGEEIPRPNAPAGWYPDPNQVATQRYWDGLTWTDQSAPLSSAPEQGWTVTINARVVLVLLSALACLVSVFLPHAEATTPFHIAHNTFMSDSDGIIILVIALAIVAAGFRDATKPKLSWALAILGLVLVALALFEGGSEQLKLVNGLGQEVASTAGPAVYVLGMGGVLAVIAAAARARTSDDPSTPPAQA
jgi:hypothetical protein